LAWLHEAYDLWRGVTIRRASRIVIPVSLFRRQEVSKCGQTCREQSWAAGRIASRSALAKATDWPASTRGAKPGKATTATPRSDIIAKAANDLIIFGLLTEVVAVPPGSGTDVQSPG
jgi:hypothetical protein